MTAVQRTGEQPVQKGGEWGRSPEGDLQGKILSLMHYLMGLRILRVVFEFCWERYSTDGCIDSDTSFIMGQVSTLEKEKKQMLKND